jgi:TRAP-type mannitol/chloroaromatic compound transport system substrate-binding protein
MKLAGGAAGLPYAFKNIWEAAYFHKVLGFEQMLREEAAQHGLYWATDKIYSNELVTSKPVKSLADLRGMKLRSSGILQVFLTNLGAAASFLPGSELYPALSTGVMDGVHWAAAAGANSMNIYEICKFHMLPPLSIAGMDMWVFNQKAIDSLPKDLQQILFDTLELHFWTTTNTYEYMDSYNLNEVVTKKGVQVIELPKEDQRKITEVAMKMWDEEAKKSKEAAKAVEMKKAFLKSLGRF